MSIMTDSETILRSALDEWKAGVDAHAPQRVAAVFTEDAIFQGLHPYTVGPRGVADYYAALPLGMTATYRILETRRLADNLILGYLNVDFAFIDQPTLTVYLGVIVQPEPNGAKISHYQVSRLGGE
jgi:hypothetical protein